MGREDWYRRTTWSQSDREAFFERLARSRSLYHKSQYVRIQASCLQGAGLIPEALALLEHLFAEWPHPSQLASAFQQRGRCELILGNVELAIEAFRRAIQTEREYPSAHTYAFLDFAWLVTTRKLTSCYAEVFELLSERYKQVMFPVDAYRFAACHALILDAEGDRPRARRYAQIALDAAAKTSSGLTHHKKLGLVTSPPDREVHSHLQRLVASEQSAAATGSD